jgi:N-acetyl-anhydromuramyl-L-alanine amidase AmpD
MSAARVSPNKTRRRAGEPIVAIVVHWTGGTYKSALDWCLRDESDVSYHDLIGRTSGEFAGIVPWKDYAAWSVGYAKSPDPRIDWVQPNRGTINVALSGGPPTRPTDWQYSTLVDTIAGYFEELQWDAGQAFRIIGHDDVAVFGPGHARAGEHGRKDDPQGLEWAQRAGEDLWLNLTNLRFDVVAALNGQPRGTDARRTN